jgi:ketosteroid isomerase-like protein
MNRTISFALSVSALILGVFQSREGALAQTALGDNVWGFMAGDAQEKGAVDQKTLEQLEARRKRYDERVNNNDAAAVAALFTEDAIFVTESGLFYGRQGVENLYAEWFDAPGWHISNYIGKIDPSSIHFLGTTDYVMLGGKWSETYQVEGEKPLQLQGYWSWIVTRVRDDWKIRLLTYNTIPPPAPATASADTK